jgi:hypothetical protein
MEVVDEYFAGGRVASGFQNSMLSAIDPKA